MHNQLDCRRRLRGPYACAVLPLLLLFVAAPLRAQLVGKCTSAKLKQVAKAASSAVKCRAKAAKQHAAVDAACLQKAQAKLDDGFAKADAENGPCFDGQSFQWSLVGELATGLTDQLDPASLNAESHFLCASAKLRVAAKAAAKHAKCHAKALKRGLPVNVACLSYASLGDGFSKAEAAGGCGTSGDNAPAVALIDQFVDSAVALLTTDAVPVRCCEASASIPSPPIMVNGCADLVLGTCSQAAALLAPAGGSAMQGGPGSVCNGASGFCESARTGTSTCCEASRDGVRICAEGPSLFANCSAANLLGTGVAFTEYSPPAHHRTCRDHFTDPVPGQPSCDP